MNVTHRVEHFQQGLEAITLKWWFYLLLLVVFFLPSYASEGLDPRNTSDLVAQVLRNSLLHRYAGVFPLAKLAPTVLVVGLAVRPQRFRKAFSGYVALLYLALAFLQNTAMTTQYGLAVLSGNLTLMLCVSAIWFWELAAGRNTFVPQHPSLWRWWVAPLAFLAFWLPIDQSLSPSFSIAALWANEAGLTYCMMTPVILAVLLLFHPSVNRAAMRVSGFVGLLFGLINMVTWFGLTPGAWWMGVMHVPLLLLSIAAFVLALRRQVIPEPNPGSSD